MPAMTTIPDLAFLRRQGWDIDILAHRRRGGRVLGLCGGYQMLGTTLSDPQGIEGPPGTVAGLGLLDVATVMTGEKRLSAARGVSLPDGTPFTGYEMHVGKTTGTDCARPFSTIGDHCEGAMSSNGRVFGTYIHGLFADDTQRSAWLQRLGTESSRLDYEARIDAVLDRLAEHMETHLDLDALLAIAR